MTDNPARSFEKYHPAVAGVLRFFEHDHLPPGEIRDMARMYGDFAYSLAYGHNPDPELIVALRKLLESKDAAVRCAVLEAKARRDVKVIPNPSEFRDGPC
jgi:hypothetical protein